MLKMLFDLFSVSTDTTVAITTAATTTAAATTSTSAVGVTTNTATATPTTSGTCPHYYKNFLSFLKT